MLQKLSDFTIKKIQRKILQIRLFVRRSVSSSFRDFYGFLTIMSSESGRYLVSPVFKHEKAPQEIIVSEVISHFKHYAFGII